MSAFQMVASKFLHKNYLRICFLHPIYASSSY